MAPPVAATQKRRKLALATTKLKADKLLVRSIAMQDQLSRLFQIEAELASEDSQIDFDDVVGHNVTIRLDTGLKESRYFNGVFSRFVQLANKGGYARYRATIVPWLWLLTRTVDCRIFQDKTTPDIIEAVFKGHGFTDYKLNLSTSYEKWEYCVQYRETDFNFVSRLMEQEGIYYYFKHEDGKHTLVLADSISAHDPCPGHSEVPFLKTDEGAVGKLGVVDWSLEREVQPGTFAINDFDFKKPKSSLLANSSISRDYGHSSFEVYDYPGQYVEANEGERLSTVRLDEFQAQFELFKGEATSRGLLTGYTFKLKNHPRSDQDREYLIAGFTLEADAGEFATGNGAEGEEFFSYEFTAIDKAQQFRPARVVPKPMIQGPQTAIVVGPEGEEIYTDEHGRVKVQFHWDRYGAYDENSSCWIRVSQYWAGKTWGTMHIPRVNQEVIVEFLEGDPDRPIITGRVYNGDQTVPYALPAEKTKSTMKSNSSKGGGGSNELRFEDKKGSEEVFLHGEKDWTVHIKNCENETVGSSISTHAGASISRNAGTDISRTANANITDKAGKSITTVATKDMSLKAGGSYQLWTSLGIHLKAMNFLADVIESGAKAAAQAIMKGGASGASGKSGLGGKAAGAAEGAEAAAKTGGMEALGPALAGVTAELNAKQSEAEKNMGESEKAGTALGTHAGELTQAISSGASKEAIAAAAMAMAGAAYDTYKDAKKLIEDMLPQIPSIVLWAMKDINATALWSMSLQTKARDISIEAKNKNVNVKGKQCVNVEACKDNLNIKASTKKVVITGKEEVNITAEDKNIVIEAKEQKVFVKAAKQIFLKCGDASISMADSGNIVIKGAKININGSDAVTVKGNPIKLN